MSTPARSYLFVPGDRPERFDKARASEAHRIILDLEDAVAPLAKDAARQSVAAWLADHPGAPALVRINAADTPWFDDDLAMLLQAPGAGLMMPKAEPRSMVTALHRLAGTARETVALVETVRGLLELRTVAAMEGVQRIAFGSIDFGMDAGMADGDEEPGMTAVRVQIALESRLAKLPPPIDGVTTALDGDAVGVQAARARRLGFGGKLCIHPRQVAGVHGAFAPTAAERAWAQAVLDAFEASGGAAVALDGKMIDKPVVERARLIAAS